MSKFPLPPESLRLRVGPFGDPETFLESGRRIVHRATQLADLRPGDRVLDLGCGVGRVAVALVEVFDVGAHYVGLDPNRDFIAWCSANLAEPEPRLVFQHFDILSKLFNPTGTIPPEVARFPFEDGTFTFLLMSSVLCHMYPDGIQRYVSEAARLLRPGGRCLVSAMLMNPAARQAVNAHTTDFLFTIPVPDWNWTCNREQPLAAIANDEVWLHDLFRARGFTLLGCEYGDWRERKGVAIEHDWLAFRKG